jgi:dolichyl-phosphate-mannose--protein O-mannosyl transferase
VSSITTSNMVILLWVLKYLAHMLESRLCQCCYATHAVTAAACALLAITAITQLCPASHSSSLNVGDARRRLRVTVAR